MDDQPVEDLDGDVVHVLRDFLEDRETFFRREGGGLRDVAGEREHDVVEEHAAALDQVEMPVRDWIEAGGKQRHSSLAGSTCHDVVSLPHRSPPGPAR